MGNFYEMEVDVMLKNFDKIVSQNYTHFIVDDESSYCLPFINPGDKWFVYICFVYLIRSIIYAHPCCDISQFTNY